MRKKRLVYRAGAIAAAALLVALIYAASRDDRGMRVWSALHAETLALMLAPHDAALRFAIGTYYFGGGAYDLAHAERAYKDTLALDADFPGAHYQLARIYFIRGNFPPALAEANEEIRRHPDYLRSYYVRGLVYGYSGDLKAAEADFKTFLASKSDSWAGNNDLAWVYFQEGKYAEAAAAARAGLAVSPGNPWLLNSLGVALLNMGDRAGARAAFTSALSALSAMSASAWGAAYPGNSPGIYGAGMESMKRSIEDNLQKAAAVNS